jgi:cell wall-associated NlpC family hydrolase
MRGDQGGQRRSLSRLLAAVFLAAGLWGCAPVAPAPPPPPPPKPTEVRDVLILPQDVSAYFSPQELDAPLLAPLVQERFAALLRERHFAPWHRTSPVHSRADALWGLGTLKQNRHYGENLRPLGPGFRAEMEALVRADTYPNTLRPAIATANTSLRVLPTVRPGFLKPGLPGEGYPFDYWQNSGLLAGTPVFVTQTSSDGAWVLVEGRVAAGWVPVADIAFVDEAFMAQWEALPLAAVTREGVGITARFSEDEAEGVYLFAGRIGTLLPLSGLDQGGVTVLAPAREASGRAVSLAAHLSLAEAEPMPLAPTPRNFARLANQLMGQPYGWGGFLGNRDCSAFLLDLYAPFGVFLPRNSSVQSRQGEWISWAGLTPEDKEASLRERGVPLLTLLHKPGHIMLYLGQKDGRAVILHDLWGLRTLDKKGEAGRFVVGRVAITTLTPGAELPEVARSGLLLPGLDGMTLVVPSQPGPAD